MKTQAPARATAVAPTPAPPGSGATRVARALLEGGPQTASGLATHLGLTGTAVRRHLDSLEASGHATATDKAPYGPAAASSARRGRGRPARYYTLTDAGREAFDQAYDDLAVGALRFLARTGGREAVAEFARAHAADLETRYATVRDAADPVAALSERLSTDGYAATVVPVPLGTQVCQHHCPVAHVASEFPELCEAETEAFARLLDTHVTRLATLAAGDGVCTTLVPTHRKDAP